MSPRPPSRLRRHARAACATLVSLPTLWISVQPATAHGPATGGSDTVALPVALALVLGPGLLAGVLAATGRIPRRWPAVSRLAVRAFGPLLLGIGAFAALSALTREPAMALAGVVLGGAAGALVAVRGDGGQCADAAVGAVAVHRLVEGLALAAAYAAGSAVGVLGVFVLAGHTVAECVAVGASPSLGRRRAVWAVVSVVVVFAAGVALGTVGAVRLAALPRLGLLGVVGGLLVALGADEVRAGRRSAAAG